MAVGHAKFVKSEGESCGVCVWPEALFLYDKCAST